MAFDFTKLMMNPQFQLGMGMLAGSGPGTSLADTARGGLLGLENYGRMQDRKEQAAYRKLQAEKFKMEMDRIKREEERQRDFEERMRELREQGAITVPDNVAPFIDLMPQETAFEFLTREPPKRQTARDVNDRLRDVETGELIFGGVTPEPKAEDRVNYTHAMGRVPMPGGQFMELPVRKGNDGSLSVQMPDGSWGQAPYGTQLYSGSVQGGRDEVFGLDDVKGVQNEYMANESMLQTYDQVLDVIRPENFGIAGGLRKIYRDIRGQAGAFDAWTENVIADAKVQPGKGEGQEFTYSKWFGEDYQDLSAMELLANTMAYQYAKSMDRSGRISDKDFAEARRALGLDRPLSNIDDFYARIQAGRKTAINNMNRAASRLQNPLFKPIGVDSGDYSNLWGD